MQNCIDSNKVLGKCLLPSRVPTLMAVPVRTQVIIKIVRNLIKVTLSELKGAADDDKNVISETKGLLLSYLDQGIKIRL